MQKQVTPAMIVVALIVLVIVIGLLWYFTMGRKQSASTDEALDTDADMMQEPPGGPPPGTGTEEDLDTG